MGVLICVLRGIGLGCLLYLIFVVLLCELGFGWGYLAYTVVWAALLVWLSVRAGASGAWFGLALVGFWVWLLACRGVCVCSVAFGRVWWL